MEHEQVELKDSDNSAWQQGLYRAVIGPRREPYYLNRFQRFEAQGKAGASWHWPAFFVTFYWLLYRKMWRNALIYFLMPLVILFTVALLGSVAGIPPDSLSKIGFIGYLFAAWVIVPMFANAVYYAHCNKKLEKAKAEHTEPQSQMAAATALGSTNRLVVGLVVAFFFTIGLLSGIAVPAYHDYVTRVQVADALAVGREAAESFSQYYSQNQTIPNSLDDTSVTVPKTPAVRDVVVGEQGIIKISLAIQGIEDKTLVLTPARGENNEVVWMCGSEDVPDKFLPPRCRTRITAN